MAEPDKRRFAERLAALETVKVSRAEPPLEAISRNTDITYRTKTPLDVTKAFKRRASAAKK